VTVSAATVARQLTRHGLVEPASKKRPKSSYIRFEAAMPNETWQSDFTHYRLADGSELGADVEIITWLDDCTRYVLHSTAHRRVSGPIVLNTFRDTVATYGIPASTLTDNGMVFTTRLSGGKGGRNGLETELRRLNVKQKNSRPNHPTTCGKVERVQQTFKKWLRAQPVQPATTAELQTLLDQFVLIYNQHRPHRSLPHRATPSTVYTSLPKAVPTASRDSDIHDRVRHDTIDGSGTVTLRVNGRLHHIGISRTLARTRVILLIQDLHVRVVDAATGELLRELVIDPRRDYQPTGPAPRRPNRPRQ
jgi:transposase InsO family protein